MGARYRHRAHPRTDKKDSGGYLCYEQLMQERPPNEGWPRRVTFSDAIIELAGYDDDLPSHVANYAKENYADH
jgi:hypothetical protein